MRSNLDFSPFYRSSIGFDRIFDMLENAVPQNGDGWPPYDIVKLAEDSYRIAIAVAGFGEDELTVTLEANLLMVSGSKPADEGQLQYLHHGLALRPFSRRFELADHVTVTGAQLKDGLLVIDLRKEIPESMKPRQISINAEQKSKASGKTIQGTRAA
jgi:molecular chaperone IbpA